MYRLYSSLAYLAIIAIAATVLVTSVIGCVVVWAALDFSNLHGSF